MKNQGCEIEARGISYKIPSPARSRSFKQWSSCSRAQDDIEEASSSTTYRNVLKNVYCRARPYEVLAIVGPSGAGKSTLLEILAGKLAPRGGCDGKDEGSIFINQRPVLKPDGFRKISGYVTQRDTLFPLLTVRETLMYSAVLRLGLPLAQVSSRVEALILELGLGHVAGARVGSGASGENRGISGGERRRVSIGVEAVHDPRILILDEPTSGLDSASALQIVSMLKAMAEARGRTVVLSIHQPGFRIVKLFNSVLLLAEGSVLHHGSVDRLQLHLGSVGVEVPAQVNVLEFAIDSIEVLQRHRREGEEVGVVAVERQATRRRDRCTLQQLFQQLKVVDEETMSSNGVVSSFSLSHDFANSRFTETAILAHRFTKNVFRTRELFACRTVQMLVSGLVLGSIFYDLKDDGVAERVGLFAFILTFLLSCTTEGLPIFLREREILMKETSGGTYRVSSYVVANALVFLPFLLILALLFSAPLYWLVGLNPRPGAFALFVLLIWLILYTANSVTACFSALVPSFVVGNSLISGAMGCFFLFSGYFIRKEGMPSYWVFMHYVSLFKYPFEALLLNEFAGTGRCVVSRMGACVLDGDALLKEEGMGDERVWRQLLVMLGFILGFRLSSYVILRFRCGLAQCGGGRN
ncbi:ras-related protein Rab-18 isoform X2 [Iris pallida]|uniref:Ras-related protein Rab-18 isoform X2 n=1 Tax=Iris pallida TaxID=29817 RepID=A0AAX6EH07_IRIPA|nr:ras-related protein Rab-18 isoform X2 [Iris pallida]